MPITPARRRQLALTAAACCALLALLMPQADADDRQPPAEDAAADPAAPESYLGVVRPSDSVAQLRTATRSFRHPAGKGPVIWLVSVVHVGDPAYYQTLQRELDGFDLVLYEGVGVPAFADPSDADAPTRIQRTREAVAFTAALVERYHERHDAYPLSLQLVRQEVASSDHRIARWVRMALRDGWGRDLHYKRGGERGFTLRSLGADGEPGGAGPDTDISAADVEPFALAAMGGGELQGSLARGLGLVFQLDAINYDRPHFKPCDMTAHQLQRAIAGEPVLDDAPADDAAPAGPDDGENAEGNAELDRVMGMLSGESMLSGLVNIGARILEAKPEWRELVKLMMVEMLGSLEGDIAASPALPPAMRELMQILVRDRNEIVMRALKDLADDKSPPATVAVFYGAGHMDDLERRIVDEMGYVPGDTRWATAFGADGEAAGLSAEELQLMRQMMQTQMRTLRGE